MRFDVSVESKALQAKLRKLEGDALRPIAAVVAKATADTEDEIRRLIGVPVGSGKPRKGSGRSRPGQPPRKDSGRMQASTKRKVSGLKGYVTVNAGDSKGRRYPFMLESGTAKVKKRPFIKKAQRKIKKQFVRELVEAVKKL